MLVKKLISGCKWISCIDVHPSGDHLIAGSYDRRVAWFDLDLSSTPYKTLKYHTKVRRIPHDCLHRRPVSGGLNDRMPIRGDIKCDSLENGTTFYGRGGMKPKLPLSGDKRDASFIATPFYLVKIDTVRPTIVLCS